MRHLAEADRRARQRKAPRHQQFQDRAIIFRHDPRRAHHAARIARHDLVGLLEMRSAPAQPAARRLSAARGSAITFCGSLLVMPACSRAFARQIQPAECRRPRRCRAGCWSVAARGRDDARAGCRRPRAGRTPAPTAARPRWRRGRNTDRASQDPARGCPAARPFPCRR